MESVSFYEFNCNSQIIFHNCEKLILATKVRVCRCSISKSSGLSMLSLLTTLNSDVKGDHIYSSGVAM